MLRSIAFGVVFTFAVFAEGSFNIAQDAVSPRQTLRDVVPAASLDERIQELNRKAADHAVGRSQPQLTEDEVVAAIRGWILDQTPGATDEIYAQFQAIAESRQLPSGAHLHFTSRWSRYRGYEFEVWWIDLTIQLDKNKTGHSAYTFRIRDRKLSSQEVP